MCGIVGFLDKTENRDAAVGHVLFDMLSTLDRRGPDFSGVAIFSDQTDQSSGGDEPPRYVIKSEARRTRAVRGRGADRAGPPDRRSDRSGLARRV